MLVIAGAGWLLLSLLSGLSLLCIAYLDGSLHDPEVAGEEPIALPTAANAEVAAMPIIANDDPIAA
jgi:hypothetical protein